MRQQVNIKKLRVKLTPGEQSFIDQLESNAISLEHSFPFLSLDASQAISNFRFDIQQQFLKTTAAIGKLEPIDQLHYYQDAYKALSEALISFKLIGIVDVQSKALTISTKNPDIIRDLEILKELFKEKVHNLSADMAMPPRNKLGDVPIDLNGPHPKPSAPASPLRYKKKPTKDKSDKAQWQDDLDRILATDFIPGHEWTKDVIDEPNTRKELLTAIDECLKYLKSLIISKQRKVVKADLATICFCALDKGFLKGPKSSKRKIPNDFCQAFFEIDIYAAFQKELKTSAYEGYFIKAKQRLRSYKGADVPL